MERLRVALALGLAIVGTRIGAPLHPQDAKRPVILFESPTDPSVVGSNRAIYSVNGDGTDLKRVTAEGDRIIGSPFPAWSPDGRQIAFVKWTQGISGGSVPTELYLIDRDGTNRRKLPIRVTEHPGERSDVVTGMAWSLDGKMLAVTRLSGLYVMPLDQMGEPKPVYQEKPELNTSSPVWSPDGKKIAFYSWSNPSGSEFEHSAAVHVVNADGTKEVTVGTRVVKSRFLQQDIPMRWSADGRQLFFPMMLANASVFAVREYVAYVDGVGEMQETGYTPLRHASPDGNRLVYVKQHRDEANEVIVMNADGSGVRQVKSDPDWDCVSAAWSGDGQKLVLSCRYVKDPCKMAAGCGWRIFVVPADGTTAKLKPVIDRDAKNPVVSPE
jgi:Tol biopolymer transport system component